MDEIRLEKIRLAHGVYEGLVTHSPAGRDAPEIIVLHMGAELSGIELTEGDAKGKWHLHFTIPPETIGDGVQSFVFMDKTQDRTLDSFAVATGTALADDLRAKVELLRAELDLLKSAFRRHCRDTGAHDTD